ncbi:hypothetical protein HID58_066359 [Brassica napus]|uniref:Uncharacterized protein n=1 Tax=Brassica napus TaxID=3708 RepID=A0ABQ7ZFX8_BRANA|nr:hypothetical protein HID58_066359 [Brassica napus]
MKRSLLQLQNIGNATPLSHVRISATFPVPEKPGSLTSSSYLHRAVNDLLTQTTPAVMKKSKLSQTTVPRRPRSSGEELPERPPAKQQRYPDCSHMVRTRQILE